MKKDTMLYLGLAAVAYFMFTSNSQASGLMPPAGSGTLPRPGGFVGPCPSPYVTGPSGCVMPATPPVYVPPATYNGGPGDGGPTDPGSELI